MNFWIIMLFNVATLRHALSHSKLINLRRSLSTNKVLKSRALFSTQTQPRQLLKLDTPEIGDRLYEQIVLPNGIPVTLVHDETSAKSSCSLSVKVGSSFDPLPGIAHITEHAVFLGSAKYPVENEYGSFLNKNGGSSNAGTGMEHTSYEFDVNSDAFPQALDIFSQFFKAPSFDHGAMSREIMAVDSEDSKNRISDSWRFYHVLKNQMNQNNMFSKFSTGNLKTLAYNDLEKYGAHMTDTIRSFHSVYYRPENMAVCMVGPQSMSELKALATDMFSDIQSVSNHSISNKQQLFAIYNPHTHKRADTLKSAEVVSPLTSTAAVSTLPVLNSAKGSKLIRINPIKDIRDLAMLWELPTTTPLYRNNPVLLLSFLLGHEGDGSLLAALQDLGWATAASSGLGAEAVDFSLFQMKITLTEDGLTNYNSVVSLVNSYLDKIKHLSDAEMQTYWSELRQSSALEFKYQEKSSIYELASHLATNMLTYPLHHALSAGYLLDEKLDVALVRDFLAKLRPDNALLCLRSKTFDSLPVDDATHIDKLLSSIYEMQRNSSEAQLETLKLSGELFSLVPSAQRQELAVRGSDNGVHIEPYYGVHYQLEDWRADAVDGAASVALAAKLHMPSANKFICADLATPPKVVKETASGGDDALKRSTPPVRVSLGGTVADEQESSSEVWHSRDEMFQQPRSVAHCMLYSDNVGDGHPVFGLIGSIFAQIATRKYYQSALAGLNYQIGFSTRGLGLAFYGFTPKLSQLAVDVSKDIGSAAFWDTQLTQELFDICKERQIRSIKSWFKESPEAQSYGLISYLLTEGKWLPLDRLAAAENTDMKYLRERLNSGLQYNKLVTYSHGNVDSSAAKLMHEAVANHIPATCSTNQSTEAVGDRARLLPAQQHNVLALPAFNEDDGNSALVTHFQANTPTSPRNSAVQMVLSQLLGEPAFTELRTKQQLGYLVHMSENEFGSGMKSVGGMTVRILSKRFSPVHMEKVLGEFLQSQQTELQAVSPEAITSLCESLVRSLQDPPTTYTEESSRYWGSITYGMPFDWTQQVIDELRRVTHADVVQAADEWLFDAQKRKSVSVMLFGNAHLSELQELQQNEESSGSDSVVAVEAEGEKDFFRQSGRKVMFNLDELAAFKDELPYSTNENNK